MREKPKAAFVGCVYCSWLAFGLPVPPVLGRRPEGWGERTHGSHVDPPQGLSVALRKALSWLGPGAEASRLQQYPWKSQALSLT